MTIDPLDPYYDYPDTQEIGMSRSDGLCSSGVKAYFGELGSAFFIFWPRKRFGADLPRQSEAETGKTTFITWETVRKSKLTFWGLGKRNYIFWQEKMTFFIQVGIGIHCFYFGGFWESTILFLGKLAQSGLIPS